jgi:dihydrofolate reductase
MVDYINNVRKFVVSSTLEEAGWNNSTLIRENALENIARLKRQPGKDITIIGSAALVRSLLEAGLVDELRLMVHPLVLGGGKRLFENGGEQETLELVSSETFGTGVVSLAYRPSGAKGT